MSQSAPPTPTVYLNGTFVPRDQAALSVEDRGTLFADGVYEVVRYFAGRAFAIDDHLARLRNSLGGIRLDAGEVAAQLPAISDELVRRNGLGEAKAYWQVTRGPAPRDHRLPATARPSVLVMTYPAPALADEPGTPVRAMLLDDVRWAHCWIKSLMLLPNVLARDEAIRAGADEAILHRQGVVTESSAANVMIVRDGAIHTHPTDGRILAGITRLHAIRVARELGLTVHERPFDAGQLLSADEVFLTGTTINVQPVISVDGKPIGSGAVGPVTTRLARAFAQHVRTMTGRPTA